MVRLLSITERLLSNVELVNEQDGAVTEQGGSRHQARRSLLISKLELPTKQGGVCYYTRWSWLLSTSDTVTKQGGSGY